MWNGMFSPNLVKHDDGQHNKDVAAHLRAQGIVPRVDRKVKVRRNPVTEEDYANDRNFYIVLVELDKEYKYLMPAAADGGPPSEAVIDKWINDYARNRVPGGRRIEDYLSIDELLNM